MTKEKPKKEFEERQPRLERSIKLSKDGKWLIVKTIRTDIRDFSAKFILKSIKNR